MKSKKCFIPVSLAIAALLDGANVPRTEASSSANKKQITGPSVSENNSSVRASRLWSRKELIEKWSVIEGHRSHYSHRSSRGGGYHGNSYHGNSHSNAHRSHYSSRNSSPGGSSGYSSRSGSNLAKRGLGRAIWNDDDNDDDNDGIPDKTIRTSTTSSTTTIPVITEDQFVQQQWRYETCWFDDGDIGAPIVLQLRNAKSEWINVKSPTARTVLQRFETVENSKCTPERPLSAVTTWAPTEPGVYYLRHFYVGFKKISTGFPYEEVIVLVVR
jgi:hypothetical protein